MSSTVAVGARHASAIHRLLSRSTAVFQPQAVQRRWWWDKAQRKHRGRYPTGKPLIRNTQDVFVNSLIPVVFLQTVKGLAKKGQIKNVKRGYARHYLVPKGIAALGTWENIDMYADPEKPEVQALKETAAAQKFQTGAATMRLPFDWVNDITLRFVRLAHEDALHRLCEPITNWNVLEELSDKHELDLLPSNLDMPAGGIVDVGDYEVPVTVQFRTPETAAGRYTVQVQAVSQQSLLAEQRNAEMERMVQESRRFVLPQRQEAGLLDDGLADEDEDEYDEDKT